MPQLQTNNTALSTQQSAQMKTTRLLKVLKIMFKSENWTGQKLNNEVNVKGSGVYRFEHGTIAYLGQPDGPKTEYLWEMTVDRARARALIEAYNQAQESEALVKTKAEVYPKDWNGLRLRSRLKLRSLKLFKKKGCCFLWMLVVGYTITQNSMKLEKLTF